MNDVEQRWWLGRMCKCDHRFGEHRAVTAPLPLGCAHAGCGCRYFDPLKPDESPPTMNDETPQPVAHEHSPVLVEPPQAFIVRGNPPAASPISDEDVRAIRLDYQKRVLAALEEWNERPSDTRSPAQVVKAVPL